MSLTWFGRGVLACALAISLTVGVAREERAEAATNATGIAYAYDDLGRLSAVADPTTGTARYSYDAVGNILSIVRQSSSTLSLIEFSPKRGVESDESHDLWNGFPAGGG